MVNLYELMRLHDAATPGPWGPNIDGHISSAKGMVCHKVHVYNTPDGREYDLPYKDDAAYICAACGAVPELVKRVRELEDAAKFEARVAKKLSAPFWNYAVAERYFELALPYRRLPAAVLLKAARLEVEADMIREGKGPGSPEEE